MYVKGCVSFKYLEVWGQGTPIENGNAIFYIGNTEQNFGVVFSPLPDELDMSWLSPLLIDSSFKTEPATDVHAKSKGLIM